MVDDELVPRANDLTGPGQAERVVAEAQMAEFAESSHSPAPVVEDRYIDVLRADWFANSVVSHRNTRNS